MASDAFYAEGHAGVLGLYDEPPRSSGEVMRRNGGLEALRLDLPTVGNGPLPEGYEQVAFDSLGAWVVYAVARRGGLSEEQANALALDWVGDSIVVMGGATEAEVAVAWRVRFSQPASAELLAQIDQVPPPEGARSIRVRDHDVQLVLSADETRLAEWEEVFPVAQVEPVQGFRAAAPSPRRVLPRPIVDPRAPRGRAPARLAQPS